MAEKQDHTDTLFEIWEVLMRFRWRFMITSFVVMIAVLGLSLLLPRKYEASALFDRRTDMVMSEIMHRGAPNSFQDPRQSLVKELAGDPALDALIERIRPRLKKLGQERGEPIDVASLRADLPRKLLVEFEIASPELDRVRVRYASRDPELARVVVNELIRGYLERTRNEIDRRLRQASDFFKMQADEARDKIETIATRKLDFEIKHGDLLPDTPNNVETVKTMAEMTLENAKQKRAALQMKVEALSERLAQTPRSTPSVVRSKNPDLNRLENKLRELESKQALYTAVYKMTDAHPDLVALRQEIEATKKKIERTDKEVVSQRTLSTNPMHEELKLHLANARSDLEAQEKQVMMLEERIARLGAASADLFPVRAQYERLTRELEEARRQLEFWEDNQRRVEMTLRAESDNRGVQLTFIKPCETIRRPVSPNLAQVLLATVGLGLFSGALAVFLAQRSDASFHSAGELGEAFNLPVFGSVSEIISRQQRRMRTLKNTVIYPANAAALGCVVCVVASVLVVHLQRPWALDSTTQKAGVGSVLAPPSDRGVEAEAEDQVQGEIHPSAWENAAPRSDNRAAPEPESDSNLEPDREAGRELHMAPAMPDAAPPASASPSQPPSSLLNVSATVRSLAPLPKPAGSSQTSSSPSDRTRE